MSIRLDEVKHIAYLSRLELSDEEAQLYTQHLSQILEYVDQLKALDVSNVEPLSHAVPMSNVFRPDQVQPSLSNEAALSNAPEREGPFFRVPRVTE